MSTPTLVIEVLLAVRRVDTGGLQMAQRINAHPHIAPRGRNRKLCDPLQYLGIINMLSVRVHVLKATATPPARYARGCTVAAPQPRDLARPCARTRSQNIWPGDTRRSTKTKRALNGPFPLACDG